MEEIRFRESRRALPSLPSHPRQWGVRYSRKRGGLAYTVKGNRAVFITLTSGKTVLVDSDTPEMLDQAISSLASEY